MGILAVLLLVLAACSQADAQAGTTYVHANLNGGWSYGAAEVGRDDVVPALVAVVERERPAAVFLNEACSGQAEHAAAALGPGWRWHFVHAWPGPSRCFPDGRFGNAVLVRTDAEARPFEVPSCNDDGADPGRCLPNWAPPAEQRRGACLDVAGAVRCSFHLDPTDWDFHDDQLAALVGMLDGLGDDVVVGADLNVAEAPLPGGWADATTATYPAGRPRRQLDHVLVRGGEVLDVRAVDLGRCERTYRSDGRCSDHRALVAVVAS